MRNTNLKKAAPFAVLVIVVGIASFYGGMRYDQAGVLAHALRFDSGQAGTTDRGNFAGGGGQAGGGFGGGRRGGGAAGGFVSGQVIAKDATSITVQMRTGGSKIVFLSESTPVMKSVSGTSNDIANGTQVMVMGTPNSDGSVTAQSVRITDNKLTN